MNIVTAASSATTEQPVPPSEEFLGALSRSGSVLITCEFCGRTHYGDGTNMEPGELELLRRKMAARPDKYIQHADRDVVSWSKIDGKQFVLDCPCNGARGYEDFIWSNRRMIAGYLTARAERQAREAQTDVATAAEATAAVERAGKVAP